MNRFIEWLVSETEPHQQDEFRLRFRRFKQKVNSTEAEELFVRDACEILDQCRDLISPLFESWIGTTSFEEFDLALDNYRRMHSGGYGHSHNSLHEDADLDSRILSDGKGRPLVTTSKTFNLFIGDMPLETTENDLRAVFAHCGNIVKVRLLQKGPKQLSFGFVHFSDSTSLHRALTEQPVVTLHGKKCRCGPSQERVTLYLSNIPQQATQRDVLLWLEKHLGKGSVVSVDIKCGPPPEFLSRQFGFVQFIDQTTCETARRRFTSESIRLFDQLINVAPADNMTPDEDTLLNVKTMFLTNVASDVSESTIRDACEKYGSLHKINYARRDKGFVYVEYNNRNDCLRAIDNLHNTKLGSQYITTALAKPKVKTPLGLTPSDSRLAGTLPYGARVRGYGRGAELMGTTLLPFGAAMGSYGRSVGGAVGASVIADRGYARRLDSRPQPYDIRSSRYSTRTDRSDRTTDREKRSYTSSTRSRDALTPSSYREWDGVYDYTRYEPSYVHAAAAVSGAYDSNAYAHLQAYYSNPSYKTH